LSSPRPIDVRGKRQPEREIVTDSTFASIFDIAISRAALVLCDPARRLDLARKSAQPFDDVE
jgi:hypothetical protein